MIIYIVHHPETVWNKKGITQGHKDSPLNVKGIKTADKLGKRLRNENIEAIYSSDLGRCVQTAEIINKSLKKKIIKTPKLRERNFGVFNGQSNVAKKINLLDPDKIAPDGESFNQMKSRVLKFIKLLKNHKKILIVTHHGPTKAILSDYYNIDSNSDKCETSTNTICKLELKDNKFINLRELYSV